MKNIKIIIVGSDFKFEEKSILEKCNNLKIDSEFILFDDLEVRIGTKTEFIKNGKNVFESLSGNEKFIIRRSRGNFEKCIAFVEILKKRNFVFTDSFRSIATNLNKEIFLTTIESEIIPHPPNSFFIEAGKNLNNYKLSFPALSKPVLGRHGEGIVIHNDQNSLQEAINKSKETLIVQDYLQIEKEYRVFVVGNKSLGVVQKIPEKGTTIANYAAGAEFIKATLPQNISKEAIELCQKQEIDIGGVDIACDKNGNYFLLEINRCPEFKAFQLATDVDVASGIINFVKEKGL
jgi:RimK family alpha-L-glutamate ligase